MLQRLSIALAHVKASNSSENLLKEIKETVCSSCQEKSIQQHNEFNKFLKQNVFCFNKF